MWLYQTSGDAKAPIVLYDWKAENAEQFLDVMRQQDIPSNASVNPIPSIAL